MIGNAAGDDPAADPGESLRRHCKTRWDQRDGTLADRLAPVIDRLCQILMIRTHNPPAIIAKRGPVGSQ